MKRKISTRDRSQKKLGLTPGAYAKIERGETDPSVSRLFQIASVLKVDITAFLMDVPIEKKDSVTRAEINNLHLQMDLLNKDFKKLQAELDILKKNRPKQSK